MTELMSALENSLRTWGWAGIFLFFPPWLAPIAAFARDSERFLIPTAGVLGILGAVLAWLILRDGGATAYSLPGLLGLGLLNGAVAGLIPWLLISLLRRLNRRGPYSPGSI
jgi:hypothetical protein